MRLIEEERYRGPSWLALRREMKKSQSGALGPWEASTMTRVFGRGEAKAGPKCSVMAEAHSTLASDVLAMLRRRPKAASQDDFRRLARTAPAHLASLLVSGNLPPRLLTFAAEAGGLVQSPSPHLIEVLLSLLEHEKAYVREGAIYGLASHRGLTRVTEALLRVSKNDQDEDIREIAQEALEQ